MSQSGEEERTDGAASHAARSLAAGADATTMNIGDRGEQAPNTRQPESASLTVGTSDVSITATPSSVAPTKALFRKVAAPFLILLGGAGLFWALLSEWPLSNSTLALLGGLFFLVGVGATSDKYLSIMSNAALSEVLPLRRILGIEAPSKPSALETASVVAKGIRAIHLLERRNEELLAGAPPRQTTAIDDVIGWCEQLRARLRLEIDTLSKRGNLNLIIGILTTLAAAGVLSYVVLTSPTGPTTNTELVLHYGPRFTFAVFIETFSFFFLRLYRATLAEIKYIQNELTNAESKIIGLLGALMSEGAEVRSGAITQFLTTERNFVLRAGETTVELERTKAERVATKELVDALSAAVKNVRGS